MLLELPVKYQNPIIEYLKTVELPKDKAELNSRIKGIIGNEYSLYGIKHGQGAPGHLLEALVGIVANNKKSADIWDVELKVYSKKTSLTTLLHNNPIESIYPLFEKYGIINDEGKKKFCKTVNVIKPNIFQVQNNPPYLTVYSNEYAVSWDIDDLVRTATNKLQNSLFVYYEKRTDDEGIEFAKYTSALYCTGFDSAGFIEHVMSGVIKIDFDYSEDHDHGVKFRTSPKNIPKIWANVKDHTEQWPIK